MIETDIDAWVDGPAFGLATGGRIQNQHAHVDGQLVTKAHDLTPPPVENVRAAPKVETAH